jgi:hypothetical protein
MNIFKKQTSDKQLIGTWQSDLNDQDTKNAIGDVIMHFTIDGKLIYEINTSEKTQIMNLTFKTKDGFIISDQPSSPRVEKTKYTLVEENYLILEFEGKQSKFIRTKK